MPSVKDTLRVMESMADRAALQELRELLDALITLHTHRALQDRKQADSLWTRLDRLLGSRAGVQPSALTPPLPELKLSLRGPDDQAATEYAIQLFDADTGDLAGTATRSSFESAVQLVRCRLGVHREYYIAGTWSGQAGRLAVSTPRGKVLARIEASAGGRTSGSAGSFVTNAPAPAGRP